MKLLKLIVPIILFILIAVFLIFLGPIRGIVTFRDRFKKGINPAWAPKTPEKWELASESKNSFYRLKEPGEYGEGVTRPAEYSLVNDFIYTDFTLKCKIRCDASLSLRYRDVVIIFGYQDDRHFYYAHFSNISDDLHNAIMLVNGDYRQRLNERVPEPMLTDLDFHDVRLRRKATGDIQVYFDERLVMAAHDTTFTKGKVGIGSFDDVASFDDVKIRGKAVKPASIE